MDLHNYTLFTRMVCSSKSESAQRKILWTLHTQGRVASHPIHTPSPPLPSRPPDQPLHAQKREIVCANLVPRPSHLGTRLAWPSITAQVQSLGVCIESYGVLSLGEADNATDVAGMQ